MKNEKGTNRINELRKKVVNRETIAYIIAGVLTTLVNFISYEGFYRLIMASNYRTEDANLNANAIAWIIAVTFAYVVNKRNVFLSKSETIKEELLKIAKFYAARLVTLVIEQLGIYVFIERMGIYRWFVKAALAVFVIVVNYIFSKLCIFNKKNVDGLK